MMSEKEFTEYCGSRHCLPNFSNDCVYRKICKKLNGYETTWLNIKNNYENIKKIIRKQKLRKLLT